MAFLRFPLRRQLVAGAFGLAVALAPAIAVISGPAPIAGSPLACPAGETEDPFTYACTPELVPNSPGGVGAPSEEALTRCSGRDQGECLEGQLYAPAPVQQPDTTVQQSP